MSPCRRHLHDSGVGRPDSWAISPHRYAYARRRRSAPASPRFRGNVHTAGRRAGIYFPWRGANDHAGSTVNIPANAPHMFKYKSGKTVHMLCMCAPAGQEEFFMALGIPVGSRMSPPKPRKTKPRGGGSWRRCCQNTERKWSRHDARAWEPIEFGAVLPRCLAIRLRLSSTELAAPLRAKRRQRGNQQDVRSKLLKPRFFEMKQCDNGSWIERKNEDAAGCNRRRRLAGEFDRGWNANATIANFDKASFELRAPGVLLLRRKFPVALPFPGRDQPRRYGATRI